MLPLKHTFHAGISAPLPGGVGYIKGRTIHADQIHLGQIGEGHHNVPLGYIATLPEANNNIYLGVGGMLNLSYIVQARPSHAVLFDINPLQTLFWEEAINTMKSGTLDEFKTFLEKSQDIVRSRLRRDFANANLSIAGCCTNEFSMNPKPESPLEWQRGFFRGLSPANWLTAPDTPAHAWLTPNHYATLQTMAKTGSIDTITLDILDTERCRTLGDFIHTHKPDCTMIYVNSMRRFLYGNKDWTGRRGIDATENNFDRNIRLLTKSPQKIVIEDNVFLHTRNSASPLTMRF